MFDSVKELFIKNGIEITNNARETSTEYSFVVYGARNSMVYYKIWGTQTNPVVNAWFGKEDNDSGGLSLQESGNIEYTLGNIIKLHKRFVLSGRRKILKKF